ncbi:zinc-ribbon domain-containing protein [Nocardia sp. NPDC058058]|uniref:zinc-ribbon domain-containing protein n=1 Tax=Nocardia sp. NPDC058058 TaxID=3346317 RepID=UPI0036DB8E14
MRKELCAAGVPIATDPEPIATGRRRDIKADMVCPDWGIVIEWDGSWFHKGPQALARDRRQSKYLNDAGWRVVRVREDLPETGPDDCIVPKTNPFDAKGVAAIVLSHLRELGFVAECLDEYLNSKDAWAEDSISDEIAALRKISLASVNPDLASEWHPIKNGSLTPSHVTVASGKTVWWLCGHGHEWPSVVGNRNSGSGCPVCAGKRVLAGANDLATVNPELAAQWHPALNDGLTAAMVTAGSNKKVWWQCERGHAFCATVANRGSGGTRCPVCAGKRVLAGANDLATVNPELAAQWHPALNDGLTAAMVTAGSNKKVWWRCGQGHEWPSTVSNRSKHGRGCPSCSGLRTVAGETDLATVNPELAAQWHPTLNGALSPEMVAPKSNKKVWWACEREHHWIATVADRSAGNGCPVCAGKRVLAGANDLATVNPELAAQWHPALNDGLTAAMVTAGSNKKVWWRCERGHEWLASVTNRDGIGTGCPACSGQRTIPGETDLATVNPELAAQWHPTLNDDLTPEMVAPKSSKKVWWACDHGHEWSARVAERSSGSGCPVCSGKKVVAGVNDLGTINPGLAAQWHPALNRDLTPGMVTAGSNRKVWWVCDHGHEWLATISNRGAGGTGCPNCRYRARN